MTKYLKQGRPGCKDDIRPLWSRNRILRWQPVGAVLVPETKAVVLVVVDVTANRELVGAHLADLGHAVRQAQDGLKALERIAAEEPDPVLHPRD